MPDRSLSHRRRHCHPAEAPPEGHRRAGCSQRPHSCISRHPLRTGNMQSWTYPATRVTLPHAEAIASYRRQPMHPSSTLPTSASHRQVHAPPRALPPAPRAPDVAVAPDPVPHRRLLCHPPPSYAVWATATATARPCGARTAVKPLPPKGPSAAPAHVDRAQRGPDPAAGEQHPPAADRSRWAGPGRLLPRQGSRRAGTGRLSPPGRRPGRLQARGHPVAGVAAMDIAQHLPPSPS